MKKQINHHKTPPNFVMLDQSILHCFKGAIQSFSTRMPPSDAIRHALNNQDFLIIDNDTGEIIKA